MTACYNAGGYTDFKEFDWLPKAPTEMAEVDKLLATAFRR